MGVFDRISGFTGGDSEAEQSDDEEASPDPNDPAGMEPVDFRDRAEDLAGRSNVPTLEFTVESLGKLDDLVAGTRRPVEDPLLLGSYLGEVFVRVYDGRWVRDGGDWTVAVDLGDDDTTVAVFAAAQMALEKGPVFQDVAARLESEGATRIDDEPPIHREIEGATDRSDVAASDDRDDADPEESDPDDLVVDDRADEADETDGDEGGADDGQGDAEDGEPDGADLDDEIPDEAELDGEELDDGGVESADDEADEEDAVDEAGEDDGVVEEHEDDEGDSDGGDGKRDPAADKPELNVTIDEIDDDYLASLEQANADESDEGEDDGVDADADGDGDEVEAEAESTETAANDSTDGAGDDETTGALDTTESAADESEDEEASADGPATDDGESTEADDGTEPAEEEGLEGDDGAEEADEEAEETDGEVRDPAEEDGEGDHEGLGVASRIAELAESGGDPDVTSSPADETGDDIEVDASVDVGDADEIERDLDEIEEGANESVDGADEAEDGAGESEDDRPLAADAEVTDVESDEPIEAEPAAEAIPTDDSADDEGEDERGVADAGDEVLEDLAAEVSGPDIPPRPELKRAARDFAEDRADYGIDFTPASLARLDAFVEGQWKGRFRPGSLADESAHPREGLRPFARVGAYYGQMLVEHLDGAWVPTENGEGAVEVTSRGEAVEVVPVFDVARECLTGESTFAYRFDALASRFDVDVAAREADDVFDVEGERADSTAVIPAILDRAEAFTEDWSDADLDYSPASLDRLDDLVDAAFAVTDRSRVRLGETTDAGSLRFTERVTSAGSYYAAVLVSHLNANWQLEDGVRLVVEGPDGSRTVDPVTVAVGAIKGDDTFAGHFDRLADRVGVEPATTD